MASGDKRLLIVDDDEKTLFYLKEVFEGECYRVAACRTASEALTDIQINGLPHLALIDLDLPDLKGFDLSAKIKAIGDVPIIFVTGKDDERTVVDGLRHYADDYMVKPVRTAELIARVRRVLSRMSNFDYAQPPVMKVDEWLSIDFGRNRVIVGGRIETLTRIESALLHNLIRSAGNVVRSDVLIARVWPAGEVYEDTLRVHMHRLRRKLEKETGDPQYIQTERGVGYSFRSVYVAQDVPDGQSEP
ncbi:MAG TPA: response regulator transcription factor [Aggregatilinea sp.]|jgi:DNA-binding response OmpR family regulator|uniref:response regulator transcription factor n=1 Tax=Aggregatilinea sp. TaxID=2806333 RepID=UPI002C0D062F|nr:response regulator transcription factor [Aggregatilinea sp.]HML24235.1 response regulator transcription factor [Aggregatilinea sp.]